MHVKNKQKSKTIGVPKLKNQCAKTEKSYLFVILKKLYIDIEFKMVFLHLSIVLSIIFQKMA